MHPLELHDVDFSYDRKHVVLQGLSFEVLPGITGLVGPNGAGKSTLCKLINGLLKPDRGSISQHHNEVFPHQRVGELAAYAFQNPDDQIFCSTVKSELEFAPKNFGVAGPTLKALVEASLRLFEIQTPLDTHPLDLPLAMRRRLTLASAFTAQRPWLILDEPTLGQDPGYLAHLTTSLKEIVDNGTSILIISHHPDFLLETCERFIVLESGRLAWRGDRCSIPHAKEPRRYLPSTVLSLSHSVQKASRPVTRSELIRTLRYRVDRFHND